MSQSTQPSLNTPPINRRSALFGVVGMGVTGLAMAAGLSGCGSSAQRRVAKRGGQLGQPIPEDPTLVHTMPYRPPAPVRTPVAQPSLTGLPQGVISRSRWSKGAPKKWLADPMGSVRRITVHHDAIDPMPTGQDAQVARRLDSIRRSHLERGWADIGYHFAIDPSGRVWEGRPLTLQGAHVRDQNQNNLGIVMLGNYDRSAPTGPALRSLDRLIATEMRRFNIGLDQIRTHRELASTACPGKNLQRAMDRTRTFNGQLASLARGDIRG